MSQSTATARVPVTRPIVRPNGRERPAQPRLRVVAPTTHRSATGLALFCVALLGGGLLVLLLLNISIGKGAYALTELQSQQRQLAENKQTLAEQVETVSAPDQLASAARKLGMVPAPNAVFVRLPDGTVEGKPAIAQAPPKPAKTADPNAAAKTTTDPKSATTKSATKSLTTKAGAKDGGTTGKPKKAASTATGNTTSTGAQAPAESKR
jgi:hypothetical protein